MANMLDDMGIPPCGHPMLEQGILLKLWASCHSSEQATYMQYVQEGLRIANDGVLYRSWSSVGEFQNLLYLHTTQSTCPSTDLNVCKLDLESFSLEWQHRAKSLGPLVYLVRGKDKDKPAWYYVLVEEDKLNMFKNELSSEIIHLLQYGVILKSGWGEDPPEEVESALKSFF